MYHKHTYKGLTISFTNFTSKIVVTSGSRVDGPKDKAKDKGSEASYGHDLTVWRSWKARQPYVEMQMDVDQGTQMNTNGKGKDMCDQMHNWTLIVFSDTKTGVSIIMRNGRGKQKWWT